MNQIGLRMGSGRRWFLEMAFQLKSELEGVKMNELEEMKKRRETRKSVRPSRDTVR